MKITSFINGWQQIRPLPDRSFRCIQALLLSLGLVSCATEPAQAPTDDDEELQAFLEYLLEFELEAGEWVDPGEFEEEPVFPEMETGRE